MPPTGGQWGEGRQTTELARTAEPGRGPLREAEVWSWRLVTLVAGGCSVLFRATRTPVFPASGGHGPPWHLGPRLGQAAT